MHYSKSTLFAQLHWCRPPRCRKRALDPGALGPQVCARAVFGPSMVSKIAQRLRSATRCYPAMSAILPRQRSDTPDPFKMASVGVANVDRSRTDRADCANQWWSSCSARQQPGQQHLAALLPSLGGAALVPPYLTCADFLCTREGWPGLYVDTTCPRANEPHLGQCVY